MQAEESKTVTLYLTRHGNTMLNNTGRMQGWCDSPLTQDGAAAVSYTHLDVYKRQGQNQG